ncbi:hypothetical protein [Plantactinospora endophytica]|nr:hypothetical protein [Plantactinospora endophytica]
MRLVTYDLGRVRVAGGGASTSKLDVPAELPRTGGRGPHAGCPVPDAVD